jgi:protein required for attachment to host cells
LGLIAGGIAFFLWYNSNSHRLNGDSVPIIDSVQLNKASNSDSAAIAKANAQLSEELGIDTNSSDASTPSSTTSVPDSKEKSSTSTESFQSSDKSTSEALLPKVVLEVNEF